MRHVLEEGLSLELLRPVHAAELLRLIDSNREHLRPWLPWVDRTNVEADVVAFIEKGLRRFADGKGFELGVCRQSGIVGVIGMHGVDETNRRAEIGYWLSRSAEGHGWMTKACRAVVEHAFGELRMHRMEIRCATANLRSQAIPERLDFRREGVLREAECHGDTYVDLVVYGALASEWKRQDAE